jgi:hypothetical protein
VEFEHRRCESSSVVSVRNPKGFEWGLQVLLPGETGEGAGPLPVSPSPNCDKRRVAQRAFEHRQVRWPPRSTAGRHAEGKGRSQGQAGSGTTPTRAGIERNRASTKPFFFRGTARAARRQ